MDKRRTIVVHGALARAHINALAAMDGAIGLQVLTFGALACRLAGGFTAPIDDESLREAIQFVLPATLLGELDGIKDLPGMVAAASETLRKVWRSGVDLQAEAGNHPRIAAMAALEAAVLERIAPSKLRPSDIVAEATTRLDFAKTLFGSVRIVGITGLSPVWQPLRRTLSS